MDGRALVSLILRLPELRFDSRHAFNVLLRALHENDLAKSFFFSFSLSSSSLHTHTLRPILYLCLSVRPFVHSFSPVVILTPTRPSLPRFNEKKEGGALTTFVVVVVVVDSSRSSSGCC